MNINNLTLQSENQHDCMTKWKRTFGKLVYKSSSKVGRE